MDISDRFDLTFSMIISSPGPYEVGQSEIARGERRSGAMGYPYLAQISVFCKSTKICPIWLVAVKPGDRGQKYAYPY